MNFQKRPWDNNNFGAVWVYELNTASNTNSIIGSKLVGTGAAGNSQQGTSVAMSSDATVIVSGGPQDDSGTGAVWVFRATTSKGTITVYTQYGNKLSPESRAIGVLAQGSYLSLSADATVILIGGLTWNGTSVMQLVSDKYVAVGLFDEVQATDTSMGDSISSVALSGDGSTIAIATGVSSQHENDDDGKDLYYTTSAALKTYIFTRRSHTCNAGYYTSISSITSSVTCIECSGVTYSCGKGVGATSCNLILLFNNNLVYLVLLVSLLITLFIGLYIGLSFSNLLMVLFASIEAGTDLIYLLMNPFSWKYSLIFVGLIACFPALHFLFCLLYWKPALPRHLPILPSKFTMWDMMTRSIFMDRVKILAWCTRWLGNDLDSIQKVLFVALIFTVVGIAQIIVSSFPMCLILLWFIINFCLFWFPCFLMGAFLWQTKLMAFQGCRNTWYWIWKGRGLEKLEREEMQSVDTRDLNEMQLVHAIIQSLPQVVVQIVNWCLTKDCYTGYQKLNAILSIGSSFFSTINMLYFYCFHMGFKKKTLRDTPLPVAPSLPLRPFPIGGFKKNSNNSSKDIIGEEEGEGGSNIGIGAPSRNLAEPLL